ncbi:hypothetical protein EHQ31_18695 [Leptospira montravelensis]|uniref:RES domain-containing protein n=2 Tax=Leptospira montravelensis TaxID=2484961 RepID=A0ABY2LL06_9LEPT|nr:hypothetical protein EHQ19_08395 [Leptospira montravelensis]TGK94994.1 hypothetical protein EHQ31_18695 [Leptospira montravelensis]
MNYSLELDWDMINQEPTQLALKNFHMTEMKYTLHRQKNATQGKFNKHKVSIFYGATNLDTVISEMRPHPGHHVSIAQFKTKKNLKIIDLTSFKLENFCNSDKELWSYNFLSHLQNFINTPILPEEKKSLYKFTIAIAEYFNQNSYSGLLYKSSISNGNNVALFDKQVTLIPGSAELYKISSVTFKKEKVI